MSLKNRLSSKGTEAVPTQRTASSKLLDFCSFPNPPIFQPGALADSGNRGLLWDRNQPRCRLETTWSAAIF